LFELRTHNLLYYISVSFCCTRNTRISRPADCSCCQYATLSYRYHGPLYRVFHCAAQISHAKQCLLTADKTLVQLCKCKKKKEKIKLNGRNSDKSVVFAQLPFAKVSKEIVLGGALLNTEVLKSTEVSNIYLILTGI